MVVMLSFTEVLSRGIDRGQYSGGQQHAEACQENQNFK